MNRTSLSSTPFPSSSPSTDTQSIPHVPSSKTKKRGIQRTQSYAQFSESNTFDSEMNRAFWSTRKVRKKEKSETFEKKIKKEHEVEKENHLSNLIEPCRNDSSEDTLELTEVKEEVKKVKKTVEEKLKYNAENAFLHMLEMQNVDEHFLKSFEQVLKEEFIPSSITMEVLAEHSRIGYKKGTRDRSINTQKTSLGLHSDVKIEVGISDCQGYRFEMEDESIAERAYFKIQEQEHFFDIAGVFDGHGGTAAAIWVKKNVVKYICEEFEKNSGEGLTKENIYNSLKKAIDQMGKEYPESQKMGTTLNLIILLNNRIWIVNLGDSRTVLIHKNGNVEQGSDDMTPKNPRFAKRILKNGDRIIDGRVNHLAVARAIGDKYHVKNISSCPKITFFELEQFINGTLISACDGVWDTITTRELAKFVCKLKKKGIETAEEISRWITFAAIKAGSKDNVTVAVLCPVKN